LGWVIICILAAIFFVVLLVRTVELVIRQWKLVMACPWTSSVGSFFGCLWQAIWALVITAFAILLVVLILFCVLTNIAALVAAF
jgi:hypothetical protein